MIRLANAGDAGQVAAIYRPYCVESAVSFESEAPDAAEMASRIEKLNLRFPWLVDPRPTGSSGAMRMLLPTAKGGVPLGGRGDDLHASAAPRTRDSGALC